MLIIRSALLLLFVITASTGYSQSESFNMTPVGPDNLLHKPWDLNLGPDGHLWVTERERGIVVRIDPESGTRDELIQIADHSSTAGQDGLLGLALHPQLLDDQPFVYLSYTHLVDGERNQRIARYQYSNQDGDGSLSDPVIILDSLPSSNDHNSGRLIWGPDDNLYYTIGDQGGNQNRNFCDPILSQVLPSQEEIDEGDWRHYPGKVLRLNPDGSIPEDNPVLGGVRSHIFSYGHRNPQGLVFASNGLLYSDEHGPNTDDEVNLITGGSNYGWPRVVGFQDDQAYDYCNWSSSANCDALDYQNGACPEGLTLLEESSFVDSNYREPLFSMFAVTDDYDYNNPACENAWICRPNVAPSSIAVYESDAIPSWKNSLLVASLKRGRVYRLKLDSQGLTVMGDTTEHFYTPNRYRDIVAHPDGKTFYILTGETGRTSGPSGLTVIRDYQNPSTILKFTLNETVSANDQRMPSPVRVWPNPTTGKITIEWQEQRESAAEAQLFNLHGQVVKTLPELQTGLTQTNIGDLPSGFYILRLQTQEGPWQQTVVIH